MRLSDVGFNVRAVIRAVIVTAICLGGALALLPGAIYATTTYKWSYGTTVGHEHNDIRGSRATLSCHNCRGYNDVPLTLGYSQVQVETHTRLDGWSDETATRFMIYGKASQGVTDNGAWKRFAYWKQRDDNPVGVWLGSTTDSSEERFAVYWSGQYCGTNPTKLPPCLVFNLDNATDEYLKETVDWGSGQDDGDDRAQSGGFILLDGIGPGPGGQHSYLFGGYDSKDNVWIRHPVTSTPSNNNLRWRS
jgi:hypothetical protein